MSEAAASPSREVALGGVARGRRLRQADWRASVQPHLVPLGITVALAVILPILVLVPPPYGDAYTVFNAARQWPDIPRDMPAIHQAMRIGLLLPVRAFQELLGDGQIAFFVASTVMNSILAIGTYAAGAALFGRLIGVAAVGLLLVHPFFVIVDPYGASTSASTGSLLPDMPAAGLFALGVAGIVAAGKATDRRQLVLLALAGTCFGLAYLVREFVALMYCGIPIFLLLVRVPLRRLIVVGAPMVAILGIELVHSALVFGDPLARIWVAAGHGEIVAPLLEAPPTPLEVLGRFLRVTARSHPLALLFLGALIVTAIGWVATRDRRLLLTLAWFLALWVPITLLAGIVNPDSPSLRSWMVRYWTSVFTPLLVGGLGALWLLVQRIPSPSARRAATGAVVAGLTLGYVVPALVEVARVPRDAAWNELRGWLAGRDDLRHFWTDGRTAQTLTFYTRTPAGEPLWTGTVSAYTAASPELPEAVGDGPVLYTPRYGTKERPSEESGWRLIWQSSDGRTLSLWER